MVSSVWIALFILQTGLIARHHHALHRKLGVASMLLAVVLVVSGFLTATHAARIGSSPPGWDHKAFLLIPLSSLALFCGFLMAGALNRHRPEHHKRLMLLAAIALLLPALARIVRVANFPLLPPGVLGGLVVLNAYWAAMLIFDVARLGRVHPATIWGALIFLIFWPIRVKFGYTEAWQAIARAMTG